MTSSGNSAERDVEAARPTPAGGLLFARSTNTVDVREVFRKVWRHKWLLTSITLIGTFIAALVIVQMAPRYTATATVMEDPRENQAVNLEAVLSGLPADQETIESEIQVLRSRGLAERVVKKLKLFEDPEFNGRLKPPTFRSKLKDALSLKNLLPDGLLERLSLKTDEVPPTEEEKLIRERVSIIDGLLARLLVLRVGRSRVIEISIIHGNPQRAAAIANTVADLYIVEQLEAKFEATRRAAQWLNERLTGLRAEVDKSERAVQEFRKTSGLVEGKGVTIASQQLSELNSQLIVARSARAEANARLRQVESLLQGASGAESVAEVLSSRLIQDLRSQEAEIQRRAAELSQEFGEKHPKMLNIRAEIADLKAKIESEVKKIVQGLRNEVAVSRARENELARGMGQMEQRVSVVNQSEVQLRALQREAEASRTLYETFLTRFKETREQTDFQRPDARIISRADTPGAPSAPKKRLLFFIAIFLSASVGIALVVLLEALDRGFRSMDQIEDQTGVVALGLVPSIRGMTKLGKAPHDLIVEQPRSAFGESIRALHASILLSNIDRPPKTVMVTSSLPNEGKTSISLSLARLVARTGTNKVLLLDCDLRRPQIHGLLGMRPGPGLIQVLTNEASLEEAIQRDEASGAFVLTAGGSPSNPTELLSSDQFASLLGNLCSGFDFIVIDTSPVLAVSDSRILTRSVDKTIFVVRWVETRREVAGRGLKQLIEAGCDLAGVVLSQVNVKKHSRYGYGDSGYYHGTYKKYYSD